MSLIKWEHPDGLNQFLDDRFLSLFNKSYWDLAVDVYEEKGSVVVKISVPEISIEDLDIIIEDRLLIVSGKRDEEKEVTGKDYYSKEIRRGSFTRSVHLPRLVDGDNVEAIYKDGILKITAPIISKAKDKKITIKSAK